MTETADPIDPVNQWLVRTAQNLIMGPYSRDQVRELIREGALGLQDEVCRANQFWIYLHEREEVMRQLEIEIPQEPPAADDDVTLTQTETQHISQQAGYSASNQASAFAAGAYGDASEQTAMISRGSGSAGSAPSLGAPTQPARPRTPLRIPKLEKVFVVGKIERLSFWRGVAWSLFTMIVVVLAILLAVLQNS